MEQPLSNLRATVSYRRGPRVPQDVIGEEDIVLRGIQYMREAVAFVRAQIPKEVPDGAKQVVITIWDDSQ